MIGILFVVSFLWKRLAFCRKLDFIPEQVHRHLFFIQVKMFWNIGKIISKRTEISPHKTAIFFEDQAITYRELNNETNRVANFFSAIGLKKGDRIAVDLFNCPEILSIYLAAAKLGLIFVPLNYRLVACELQRQLTGCGARLLIFSDRNRENIEPIISSIQVESDKYFWVSDNFEKHVSCPSWALEFQREISRYPCEEPCPEYKIEMDDPLAFLYTADTVGVPKAVVLSHNQTFYKFFQIKIYCVLRAEDIVLSQIPLCESGGLFIIATPVLCNGAAFVLRRAFHPDRFIKDIEQYEATIVLALNSMWHQIFKTSEVEKTDFSNARILLGGGEKPSFWLLKKSLELGLHIQTGFGQVENSAMMFMPVDNLKIKRGSIGLPGYFNDSWIEDEDGNRLPAGEIGEIVTKGPTIMSGYWNRAEKKTEPLIDNVLHTGILGYVDKDGYFFMIDRLKDMYRNNGKDVYPVEVEKVMGDHPKIKNVAIVGVSDDYGQETGMAFIVSYPGKRVTKNEVYEFLKGKVAKFKYPRNIVFVETLPVSTTGDIEKSLLKQENVQISAINSI